MNEIDSPDTSSQIAALQRQVFTLLIALVVVSGTFTAFMYRQASLAGKDITAISPQANQVINTFNQNQQVMANFINEIVAYGQAHPEFRPVLAKYNIAPIPGIPAGSTANAVPKPPKK